MVNVKDTITSCILFMQLFIVCITGQNSRVNNDVHWDSVKLHLRDASSKFQNVACKTNENKRLVNSEKFEKCLRPEFDNLMKTFDSDKVEANTDVTNGINNIRIGKQLEPKEINALKKNIGAPICKFVPGVIKCTKSELIEAIEHCVSPSDVKLFIKSIEYIEVVIKSICKNDGERIIEFFSIGGAYCMESYAHRGKECLLNKSELIQREKTEATILELCNSIGIIHNCFSQSLNYCEKKKPSEILHSILDDVKPWISKSCLISSANIVQSFTSLILIPIIYVLTKVIHYGV